MPTIAPARRIAANSRWFLRVTAMCPHQLQHAIGDLRYFAHTINLTQQTLFVVILNQWHRLRKVDFEPMPRSFHCIITALIELTTTFITNVWTFGWEVIYIIR
jgi:hypothetical protein